MIKKDLRKQFLEKRNLVDYAEIESLSEKVSRRIVLSERFRTCESVFIYVSVGKEVNTQHIIDYSFLTDKKVAVPVIRSGEMFFSSIESLKELKPTGVYGIPEPINPKRIYPDEKTLFLMPGVVFDVKGSRIGMGGGYYDRYLKTVNVLKTALAFELQITKEIIQEDFDIKVDEIVTENRWIFTGGETND